jgi:hypothetical protein
MHRHPFARRLSAGALAVLPLVAANLHASTPRDEKRQSVSINFAAMVGDAAFACGQSYPNIGTSKSTITPSEFRVFVHGVELLTADGKAVPVTLEQDGKWQSENVAMLDFENGTGPCSNGTAETRTVIMFWAWNSGHKFVRLDAKTESGKNWVLHLGSAACSPNESATAAPTQCTYGNRATMQFDKFDLSRDVIVADIAALYAGSNLEENQPRTAAGCMSGPSDSDCGPIFSKLGLPFNDTPAVPQQFMRAKSGAVRTARTP